MKISLKKYQSIRIWMVVILSIIFSQSITFGNYIVPIFVMIIASLILLYLRKNVTEIIADERDYELWWKSALLSIQIFSWFAAISMFVLYSFKNLNPNFEIIAVTLALSTCLLMLLYGFIFRIYNRNSFKDLKLVLSWVVLFILLIGTIRIFSWEDDWVCNNWEWIKHWNPQFSKPNIACEKKSEDKSYKIEKILDVSCKIDQECKTPWKYLIQSRCPFTSKCIKNKCTVICPKF